MIELPGDTAAIDILLSRVAKIENRLDKISKELEEFKKHWHYIYPLRVGESATSTSQPYYQEE